MELSECRGWQWVIGEFNLDEPSEALRHCINVKNDLAGAPGEIERLAAETEGKRFEVLKPFLLGEKGGLSYEEAAAHLGMAVPAVTSAIHRMRGRFRLLLFEEVANTVEGPEEVEPEIRHLLGALGD